MFLALSFRCATAQGNARSYKFGEISRSDLEMQFYERDSSAAAVILLDHGVLDYDDSRNRISLTRHTIIKILKPVAFELADLSLSHKGSGGIRKIKGATYNLSKGEVVTSLLTEKNIFEEKSQNSYRKTHLLFPDVSVGSVIEYTYQMFSLNLWEYLPWYFQSSYPVKRSELQLLVPGGKRLYPRVFGVFDLSSYERGDNQEHYLVMEDLPAFSKEPFVNAVSDYYSKVNFEYLGPSSFTWQMVIDRVLEDKEFGVSISRLNQLKEIYPKSRGWTADRKSIREIHTYVKNHMEWNGYLGKFFSNKPKKIWESRVGTSSDINLLLLMFLREAGIKSNPVFLSTKDYGIVERHLPSLSQFNNVVVVAEVEGESYLLDATSKNLTFDIIPEYCLNDSGLVVKSGSPEWISMYRNNQKSLRSVSVKYKIDNLGKVVGQGDVNWSNSAAMKVRASYLNKEDAEILRDFDLKLPRLEIEGLDFKGMDDPYENLRVSFGFNSEILVNDMGGELFFSPVVWTEIDETPFKALNRVLPVNFPIVTNRRYFFNATIPEGYEVSELPEPVNFVLPNGGGRYVYNCEQKGNTVQTIVRFQLERSNFTAAEYPAIRELFMLIIAKQEELVVLVEKKGN